METPNPMEHEAQTAPEAQNVAPASKRNTMMRYVIAVLGVIVVVAGLAGIKGKQISTLIGAGKQFQKAGPPPEAVSTSVAQEQTWEATLSAVGSITTGKGVSIGNDAPGIVSAIHFDSGQMARQGQVLVELDSRVERAQLASARARNELASTSAKRTRALIASNAVAPSQLDNDESALRGATADVGALEAQIERKIVRAPFSGKLGIRQVNIGQYLNAGTTITVLESSVASFVDFTLPQQELEHLSLGMPVRVSIAGADAGGPAAPSQPSNRPSTRRRAPSRCEPPCPASTSRCDPGPSWTSRSYCPKRASWSLFPRRPSFTR